MPNPFDSLEEYQYIDVVFDKREGKLFMCYSYLSLRNYKLHLDVD